MQCKTSGPTLPTVQQPLRDITEGSASDNMQLSLWPQQLQDICSRFPEDPLTHFNVLNWWNYPLKGRLTDLCR